MIKPLASGPTRGCSWVWLSVAVTGVSVTLWFGQTSAFAQTAEPKAEAPADPAAPDAAEPAEPADDGPPRGSIEVFKDPRAEAALGIFEGVPGLRDCRPNDINDVKRMAVRDAVLDRQSVQRFVDGMAYRLLDRGNINGLIAPPPNLPPTASAIRAIKETTSNLIDTLNLARQAKHTQFLTVYNQALLSTFPKLLDKNLVTRVEAMIVLGQTGDPNAVPLYISQLKDPEQTFWVKLWAAKGLSTVVEDGARVDSVISVQRASESGKAIADFLKSEEEIPWPVQLRAVQALGAMRQAAVPINLRETEMANAAMALLVDAEGRPEVRSAAAWALGMLRINSVVDKYNFPLVAHAIGTLAAEIGVAVSECYGDSPVVALDQTRAEYFAGLLVDPVFQSFNGNEKVRESGLLKASPGHPNFSSNQAAIRQVGDLTNALIKAAVELVRAPPGLLEARQKDLNDRISALKAELAKSAPKDFHLVPGGPEFAPPATASAAPVASAPAAGAPVGR